MSQVTAMSPIAKYMIKSSTALLYNEDELPLQLLRII